ncbi:hypothetical protein L6164_007783 [Bauhinia variegata]|uniref:Uncharacterized protein n=1 Tax=Bauhinia variegata TaxID=167791 RepID=A0ACB9PEE8_BAUVA|nr:hypothetical protein L6164_007783 [Bauhinia variegata]
MASDDRFWPLELEEPKLKLLEDTRLKMEEKYKASISKVQTVPSYLREQEKYEKYYLSKLISIGPIHHGDPNLKRGENYKLMWASMYARETGKTPQDLYQRIANNIEELRGLFSWDDLKHAHNYTKRIWPGCCLWMDVLCFKY